MKKFFIGLLSILAVGCLSVGFSACNGDGKKPASVESSSDSQTVENEGVENSPSLAYTLSEDKSSYAVSGIGSYIDKEVVIPASYHNLPVTEIAEGAFQESAVTKITLPDTVTVIGKSAFEYCKDLQFVTLGASVKTVGELAFSNCESLQTVLFSEGVQTIENYAFQNCHKLNFSALPSTLKYIGKAAFFGVALQELHLPDALETLGSHAFGSCSKLKKLTVGSSLQTIGSCAFSHCVELQQIDLGDCVTTIQGAAFSECRKLSLVKLGKGLTSIEELAFQKCFQLYTVRYGGGVGDWCAISFEDEQSNPLSLSSMTELYIGGSLVTGELVIPDTVTSIRAYAFYRYSPITSVVIGESVSHIGLFAFQDTSVSSALFKNPTGWKIESYGKSLDFSDPDTAADSLNNILRQTYAYVREA